MERAAGSPVPQWLRVASEWAWRLLAIGLAVIAVSYAFGYLSLVTVPVIVSLFACALLEPIRRRLLRIGFSSTVASAISFLVGVLLITTVAGVVVGQVVSNFDELTTQFQQGVSRLAKSLAGPPFRIEPNSIERAIDDALDDVKSKPTQALSGAASVLSTTGGLLAGGILAFITTLFFMMDRQRIRRGVLAMLPATSRASVDHAARSAWEVLVSYVRITLTEAIFDSFLIGGAAAIAGLPIPFALGAIVFLAAFVPTVGAIVSGALVVAVAFVTKGTTVAIVLAVIVLVVQQLDANVLYPMLTSRRVSVHPLMSLLLVAAGGITAGLFGAFVAVPAAAMLGAAYRSAQPPDGTEPGRLLP